MHGGEACAALISGLIAPGGPEADRHETLWHYQCSSPGVACGDLWFYRVDGDLREVTQRIGAAKRPLFMLTGEYDYSCEPGDFVRTAGRIDGAKLKIMDRLEHFPMSENPEKFREHLLPVLEEIRALQAGGLPQVERAGGGEGRSFTSRADNGAQSALRRWWWRP